MTTLASAMATNAEAIERELDRLLPLAEGSQARLHAAMRYATLGGGKRLRPFLVVASGALFDVPHGVANAIFLPHVLAYNLPACTPKMAALARQTGIVTADDTHAAEKFIERITRLSKRLEIPGFRDLNIGPDQFETIARMSFQNNSNPSNPRSLEREDYVKILKKAFEQGM